MYNPHPHPMQVPGWVCWSVETCSVAFHVSSPYIWFIMPSCVILSEAAVVNICFLNWWKPCDTSGPCLLHNADSFPRCWVRINWLHRHPWAVSWTLIHGLLLFFRLLEHWWHWWHIKRHSNVCFEEAGICLTDEASPHCSGCLKASQRYFLPSIIYQLSHYHYLWANNV